MPFGGIQTTPQPLDPGRIRSTQRTDRHHPPVTQRLLRTRRRSREDRGGTRREALLERGEDLTAALLARAVGADALLLLTDVRAVIDGFGTSGARPIHHATPAELRTRSFPAGSMGPKVDAACRLVEATGHMAAIGSLDEAGALIRLEASTIVSAA